MWATLPPRTRVYAASGVLQVSQKSSLMPNSSQWGRSTTSAPSTVQTSGATEVSSCASADGDFLYRTSEFLLLLGPAFQLREQIDERHGGSD
jgi:hypothetical protein